MTMTESQRLRATLEGDGADRFPFFDLDPADATVDAWRCQGLPAGTSVGDHFNLEPHHSVGLELRSAPVYRLGGDLLDPDFFARHADADDPRLLPDDFERRCRQLEREGRVRYLSASGGGLLQMLGVHDWDSLMTACEAMVKRPDEVDSLMARSTDFYCRYLDRVLTQVQVDYASLYEPIAANDGPVVSPAMFERYSMPGYRRIVELLRRHEVPMIVFCTTGGDLGPLLPMLVDTGIDCLWISNIMAAGMDYASLRREYGPEMALIGGIDATALNRDREAVRRAVMDTVPRLLDGGRYLPCLDDRPRENASFALYSHYRELLADLAAG
ncbi:MAG: uroporphyrinogen decarboxylase family protein [Holophagae bacterium]|jgi:hypothetical protein